MKKALLLVALLTVIVLHNDSGSNINFNLLVQHPVYGWVDLMGGRLLPLESITSPGWYKGPTILRHYVVDKNGSTTEGLKVRFSLKEWENASIHLPLLSHDDVIKYELITVGRGL